MRAKIRGYGQTRRHGAVLGGTKMDDVIKGESKSFRRARNSEGAGIFVWSSGDTSPRIMIEKDIESSTVSKAMKVSNKCRRVTKKTSFIQLFIQRINHSTSIYGAPTICQLSWCTDDSNEGT